MHRNLQTFHRLKFLFSHFFWQTLWLRKVKYWWKLVSDRSCFEPTSHLGDNILYQLVIATTMQHNKWPHNKWLKIAIIYSQVCAGWLGYSWSCIVGGGSPWRRWLPSMWLLSFSWCQWTGQSTSSDHDDRCANMYVEMDKPLVLSWTRYISAVFPFHRQKTNPESRSGEIHGTLLWKELQVITEKV